MVRDNQLLNVFFFLFILPSFYLFFDFRFRFRLPLLHFLPSFLPFDFVTRLSFLPFYHRVCVSFSTKTIRISGNFSSFYNNNNDDDDDGGGGGGCRRNDGDRCGYTRRSQLLSKEKESVRGGEGIGR